MSQIPRTPRVVAVAVLIRQELSTSWGTIIQHRSQDEDGVVGKVLKLPSGGGRFRWTCVGS
jgi:hypothetical protein